MKKAFIIFLACVLLLPAIAMAQELKVVDTQLAQDDNTAVKDQVKDINDVVCALLKIDAGNLEGLAFPNKNEYVSTTSKNGLYYVYVPSGFYKLTLQHEKYPRLEINFKEQFGIKFKSGKTYNVKLDVPSTARIDKSDIYINVYPTTATLVVNGDTLPYNGEGKYQFQAEQGNYTYSVTADGYQSRKGSFSINSPTSKTIMARLQPILVNVTFQGNRENASVFIDDVNYGSVGTMKVPVGRHQLRIADDGYIDYQDNAIFQNDKTISFVLNKNTNVKDVHAVPITVMTKSKRLYKNNKLVREYEKIPGGYVIQLMPSKYPDKAESYELSDGLMNHEIVYVKQNQPQTIKL